MNRKNFSNTSEFSGQYPLFIAFFFIREAKLSELLLDLSGSKFISISQ